MAETPESKVKDFVKRYMFMTFEDIWYYSAPGGVFGRAGVPDHLYLWRGVLIAIEIKAEGNKPTMLQWKHLKHIARQGGVAAVVTGKDLAKMNKIKSVVLARASNEPKSST